MEHRATAPLSTQTFGVQLRKKKATYPQRVHSHSRKKKTPDERTLSTARRALRVARYKKGVVYRKLVAGDTNADTKELKYKVPSRLPRRHEEPLLHAVLRKNTYEAKILLEKAILVANMIVIRLQATIGNQLNRIRCINEEPYEFNTIIKLFQGYVTRDQSSSNHLLICGPDRRNEYTTTWRDIT
ncbi:uncharacterized protein MELLADRAFT_111747 [Melampsora larici-populina 98AG31]|uniref:Uncharacterized protein n=1 Tax=Melampsora larici-populina (strain 98AG31 / pathotype 3-4-7) TaxID=747676 RepID=F4S436_MELLP|nr:uncharacterized protein MELLADRAFT_111747 [Melampsora larici-populina 98AG31]EGG00516.1 hypothetical protein MELLADRAFT_111747 [Melampsora larici-populina 98AG31]